MFDFRLKVFDTVAKRLNFTRAARELHITQPAVTKHVQEIEHQLGTQLFGRNGTKISLTASGNVLLKYTEQLFGIYRDMEFEIAQLSKQYKGLLRIGASTTIAQYVLPPVLAEFHGKFKDIKIELTIHNTEMIEQLLEQKKIDIGLIEGSSKSSLFHYTPFLKDEIVLVAKAAHPLAQKNMLKAEDLKSIPLLLREPGSGTLETLSFALKSVGIKINELQVEMQLGNTESIKLYLLHSDAMALLSIHSVLQELRNNTLTIIDVKKLSIERDFQFIQLLGAHNSLTALFLNFAQRYNFKL